MLRKPGSQLQLPLIALFLLALILSTATLACASKTLSLFNNQQSTNPWLLPLWRGHFDLRGLKLVVGTSAAIVLCDFVAVVAVLLPVVGVSISPRRPKANELGLRAVKTMRKWPYLTPCLNSSTPSLHQSLSWQQQPQASSQPSSPSQQPSCLLSLTPARLPKTRYKAGPAAGSLQDSAPTTECQTTSAECVAKV